MPMATLRLDFLNATHSFNVLARLGRRTNYCWVLYFIIQFYC